MFVYGDPRFQDARRQRRGDASGARRRAGPANMPVRLECTPPGTSCGRIPRWRIVRVMTVVSLPLSSSVNYHPLIPPLARLRGVHDRAPQTIDREIERTRNVFPPPPRRRSHAPTTRCHSRPLQVLVLLGPEFRRPGATPLYMPILDIALPALPGTICMASETADLALARRCAAGDPTALRELYAAHRASVHRILQLHARRGQGVEDLVHDTFVCALERLHRYRGEAPLDVWLRGIAVNLARTEQTRSTRRAGILKAGTPLVTAGPDAEAQVEVRSAFRQLLALMERLPETDREAFALLSVQQLSLEEAAALSGCAVSTLSDRNRRAQRLLKTWFEDDDR